MAKGGGGFFCFFILFFERAKSCEHVGKSERMGGGGGHRSSIYEFHSIYVQSTLNVCTKVPLKLHNLHPPFLERRKEKKKKKFVSKSCFAVATSPHLISTNYIKKEFPPKGQNQRSLFYDFFFLTQEGGEGREKKKRDRSIGGRPADPFHFKFLHMYVARPNPHFSHLSPLSLPPWPRPPRSPPSRVNKKI